MCGCVIILVIPNGRWFKEETHKIGIHIEAQYFFDGEHGRKWSFLDLPKVGRFGDGLGGVGWRFSMAISLDGV